MHQSIPCQLSKHKLVDTKEANDFQDLEYRGPRTAGGFARLEIRKPTESFRQHKLILWNVNSNSVPMWQSTTHHRCECMRKMPYTHYEDKSSVIREMFLSSLIANSRLKPYYMFFAGGSLSTCCATLPINLNASRCSCHCHKSWACCVTRSKAPEQVRKCMGLRLDLSVLSRSASKPTWTRLFDEDCVICCIVAGDFEQRLHCWGFFCFSTTHTV